MYINRFGSVIPFCIIAINCFILYYLYSDKFGVYGDDQFFIAVYQLGNTTQLLVKSAIWFGRPLGFSSFSVLYPLYAVGGLPLAYLGSCLVLTFETWIVCSFLRIFLPNVPSLMLSLVYLLYPPYVSKFMFVHALFSHVSGIMFWISLILYARQMPIASALVISLSMLVYETHILQAPFVPLICHALSQFRSAEIHRWKDKLYPGAKFIAAFVILATVLLIGRLLIAPGRLPTSLPGGFVEMLERFLFAGFSGIGALLRSHPARAVSLVSSVSFAITVVLSLLLVLNLFLLRAWKNNNVESEEPAITQRGDWKWAGSLMLIGLGMMFVSYLPFALEPNRFPPRSITGQTSNTHYGAAAGYVLCWVSLFGMLLAKFGRTGLNGFAMLFVSYFLITGGFFLHHQENLVQNWEHQSIYWEEIEQCLRTSDPKLIVIDDEDEEARAGRKIPLFDWTTPYVPFLVRHSIRQAANWPLVLDLGLFREKSKIVDDYIELSDMTTWHGTELRVLASDITLVKPFRGALTEPSVFLELQGSRLIPGNRCYVRSTGSSG